MTVRTTVTASDAIDAAEPVPAGRAHAPPDAGALALLALGLVVGDALLLARDGEDAFLGAGPGLAIFAVLAALALGDRFRATPAIGPALALAVLAATLIETASPLLALLTLAALGAFAVGRAGLDGTAARAVLAVPRGATDLVRTVLGTLRPTHAVGALRAGAGWWAPLGVGAVFVTLLMPANPWLAALVASLDPLAWIGLPAPVRIWLWVLIALGLWPLLRGPALIAARTGVPVGAVLALAVPAVPVAAAARTLVVANAVFLVQTLTDAANLWPTVLWRGAGGLALPPGTSFAAYAHAGSHPLVIAAILAALIVLVVMREGTAAARSPGLRWMVGLWLAQCLALVASAALRLDLYVDAYGLTRLRLAAFAWMGLIAIGLALTALRVRTRRGNAWLVSRSLAALALTLYGWAAWDVDGTIARHNAARPGIDLAHLATLGPGALPVIARFVRSPARGTTMSHDDANRLNAAYSRLRADLARRQSDPRTRTRRGARILYASPPLDTPVGPGEGADPTRAPL